MVNDYITRTKNKYKKKPAWRLRSDQKHIGLQVKQPPDDKSRMSNQVS